MLVAALWLGGCAVTPQRGPVVQWRTTDLGLCEDYPEEGRSLAAARRDLATARAAGAQVLRIGFAWDAMEPEPGRYDWGFWDDFVQLATTEYNLRLIPYVCYTPKWAATDAGENFWRSPPRDPADFGRFMNALVHRYGARIHTWELWNEPDNPATWVGTASQFAALVRAGSAAVRQADPQATVVLGGLAGELDFLAHLLKDEHLGPAVDVVNIHSYYETWHPGPIEHLPDYVGAASGLIRDTRGTQPLWMAGTGYSSVGGRAEVSSVYRAHYRGEHTDEAQARALVRTLAGGLATEQLALIAWHRINDLRSGRSVADDNGRHFGLREAGGAPKPALAAFAYLAGLFRQPYEVLTPEVNIEPGARGRMELRAFRLWDGRRIVVAWMAIPDEPAPAEPARDDRQATVRILVPGRTTEARWREAAGRTSAPFDASWQGSRRGTEVRWTIAGGDVQILELLP